MKLLITILCLMGALATIVHHYWKHKELKGLERLIQWHDINDHEDLFVALVFTAIGIAIGAYL